jgi:hypothetical protein
MQPEQAWNPQTELEVTLNDAPDQIEYHIAIEDGCKEGYTRLLYEIE